MSAAATGAQAAPPLRKAAVLLLALGEDSSASILKNLPPDLVKKIGSEMAQIGSVGPEEVAATLEEFHRVVSSSSGSRRGGVEFTRRVLANAFGGPEAEKLFRKMASSGPARLIAPELDVVEEAEPGQLARLLQTERAQTVALLLAQFKPERAAAVFAVLPEALRAEVAMRISRTELVSEDVIRTVVNSFARRLKDMGDVDRRPQNGVKTMADLLNRLDPQLSEEVLSHLQVENEPLAEAVKQLLFIFEDLMLLDDNAIRELVSRADRKVLAIALKGTSADLQKYILSSMSQRGAAMFLEDMESLGPVRIKDVQAAQQEIIASARKLESEGVISLRGGGDQQYVS